MPLRAVAMGIQATSALVGASVNTAATAAGTLGSVATAGVNVATTPVRESVKALSGGLAPSTLGRHSWRGNGRAWIEVRGLSGRNGAELGREVLQAVRLQPGVTSAALNRPLSRVVIGIDDAGASLGDLCRAVENAEKRAPGDRKRSHGGRPGARSASLPGDGLLLAARAATVGANAAGLGAAVVARALRWPPLPNAVIAAVVAANYQPRLRRLLEDRVGTHAADTVLELAMAVAETVTLSVGSLAVDLTMEMVKAAESLAEARAWSRYEPELARHADHPDVHQPSRSLPRPPGPVERHADRAALVQAIGTAVIGAATRSLNMAATATLVTAPKASRTTRESFAATLGRGLADQHGVLPLCPESLRRLDRVDALLIDPRVLCGDTLRVLRIRGAREDELSVAWNEAQALLKRSDVGPGWHPVPGIPTRRSGRAAADIEALICPAHEPLASAVMAEARRAGLDMVSVDDAALGELAPSFDEIRQLGSNGSIDDALAAALAGLQEAGRTVAVLSSAASQALSSADLSLGVMSGPGSPPWYADLMLTDLASAWRVLHALPAAKSASQRGVEISTAATALGSLLMLPGVIGRGPGPVTTGAAAGLFSGYMLARGVVRAPAPRPAPVHEWHAMSVEQVRELLPPPDSLENAEPHHRSRATRALSTAQRGAQVAGKPRRAVWDFVRAVRAELSDPLTPVLAIGSAASAVLGSPVDAVLVGSVLSGNAVLAASQRLRAENRLNKLLAQQIPPARKVTPGPDGTPVYTKVIAEQLLPGDVIEVRTNEVVPADARLIEEEDLEVDESTLTGESLSVEKQVEATPGADLAERRCMLYAGTTVVAGTAVALVTAVGADTQERRAAELVSTELPPIGLQHQLSQLTNRAFPVSIAGGALVGGLGLLRRRGLRQAVASGIALAVAAVPEGMPLVATLAQAASARRLTHFGALVRVPRSVEALGRVDVVCFDKTGTLSENRLRVTQVHPVRGHTREDVLHAAAHAAPAPNGGPQVHATDRAIIEAALAVNGSHPFREADAHLPFRSGRSFSASVTGTELTVKGAPEVVLAACEDTGPDMDDTVHQLATGGLRVIAVARRRLTPQQAQAVQVDEDAIDELCYDGLSLAGFLGLSDTPRAQARELLAALSERDVAVRLITGDHPVTATAIAQELGMPVTADDVVSGSDWDAMSRKEQERVVAERVIFARMTPENKVQIVQTLERTGKVCAMVGDGSNDAAAIRAATAGIGVIARGSDPASVAADVVLLDARIEALLHAIEEGRELWRRVQAAVSVLLGGNAGEVAFAIIGSAITGNSPLNTRQLLLVNIFTDALPAAALAVSPTTGAGNREGRGPDQRALWRAVAIRGTTTAAAATAAWAMTGLIGLPQRASTAALVALVSAQLGQTLLDSHAPLVVFTALGSLGAMATLISIPGVSQMLGCTPLDPLAWAQAMGSATVATIAVAVATRLLAARRTAELQPSTRDA
ncbi:MAG: cation-translocating P-type ATPase, partial [Mycobacterium sp.]|nr:cation-translocating P-type ATPase [Mycobacterium sp.]